MCSPKPEEGVRFPGAGVTAMSERVGAGNRTQELCQGSQCSQWLSCRSSPSELLLSLRNILFPFCWWFSGCFVVLLLLYLLLFNFMVQCFYLLINFDFLFFLTCVCVCCNFIFYGYSVAYIKYYRYKILFYLKATFLSSEQIC